MEARSFPNFLTAWALVPWLVNAECSSPLRACDKGFRDNKSHGYGVSLLMLDTRVELLDLQCRGLACCIICQGCLKVQHNCTALVSGSLPSSVLYLNDEGITVMLGSR